MTPASKHRWFRFSLRTLFVVVTVAAVLSSWVVYQLNWIRQRHQAREWLAAKEASWYAPCIPGAKAQATAPWGLRLLGEQACVGIGVDVEEFGNPTPYSRAQLQRLFPECRVDLSRDGRWIVDP